MGEGLPPRKMSKDQNASGKKEWRKSSGIESVIQSVTELGEAYTKARAVLTTVPREPEPGALCPGGVHELAECKY